MSDLLIKKDILGAKECVSMRDNLLYLYTKIAKKGWRQFQRILILAEENPNSWDKNETQKELRDLCALIDVRYLNADQDTENYEIGMSLKEFVRGYQNGLLNISWDIEFFSSYLLTSNENELPNHLYPEDILSLFIILDRTIIFHKEEQRLHKYELTRQRIKNLNEERLHLKNVK